MDESGSIGSTDFKKMKTFAKDLVAEFEIGDQATRFGVVTFGSSSHLEIPLSDHTSLSALQTAILALSYSSGSSTNMGAAMNFTRNNAFKDARPDVDKIAILITDGQPSDTPYQAATNLRNAGVTIFCIGIGDGIDRTVLEAISTVPQYTATADSFDLLDEIKGEMANGTCAYSKYACS